MTLDSGKRKLEDGLSVSAGAADSGKIVETNADGKIDDSLLPDQDIREVDSGEALSAGDYVHIDSSGEAVKADFSNGRGADGFVKDSVSAGVAVKVYFEGVNADLSSLTAGTRYYLDTTGNVTATPKDPDTANAGEIHQYIGKAVSTTEIQTEIQDCVVLA